MAEGESGSGVQGDLEKELTCSVSRVLFSRWCCAGGGGDMRQAERHFRRKARRDEGTKDALLQRRRSDMRHATCDMRLGSLLL
jgi:hypothetical protein